MSIATSPTRRRIVAAVAVLAVSVGAVGCSSDDSGSSATTTSTTAATSDGTTVDPGSDSSTTAVTDVASATEADYVAGMTASLGSSGQFTDEEKACMAEGLVGEIGYEAWKDAGVAPSELANDNPFAELGLDTAEAEKLYTILDDCAGGLYEASVDSILGGDESKRACVEDALTEEQLKQVFIDAFQGKQDEGAAYAAGLSACMTDG
ncbi:MAG: hypothetical protein KF906_04115 [Actinobacteria bacterium]|nr:hypothetical protein [Actinomycetota bacterium]